MSETRLIYRAAGPESDEAERKQRVYREAARAAGRLGVVLLNCDDGSEGETLGRLPAASFSTFDTLENVIAYAARLRVAAVEAREESLRHRGPERPPALDRAVQALTRLVFSKRVDCR